MLKIFLPTLLLAFLVHLGSTTETGCPAQEDVAPCKCNVTRGVVGLVCGNVNDVEDLRRALKSSEKYTYYKVTIEHSSLPYLPHELFDGVRIRELNLKYLTLDQLFDTTPSEALEFLSKLTIEKISLTSGELWKLFQPLKTIEYLSIYSITIESLGNEIVQYAPKGLKHLFLSNTKTRTIEAGVFKNFTNLEIVGVTESKLEELSRNMFPEPFNVKSLHFSNNAISRLSEDIFHQMPNLSDIMMSNNQLSTLPESAFDGNFGNLHMLYLSGNPLKCDCNLQWVVRRKPLNLWGKCVKPKSLNGRELKDLQPSDFTC